VAYCTYRFIPLYPSFCIHGARTGIVKKYIIVCSHTHLNCFPSRIDAENYKEHEEVAQAGVDAISNGKFKFPSNYTTIPTYKLYVAGGSSSDYAYKIGFPLSMTWELPEKRGNLSFEFHPPTNLIKELVEETWIGMRAIAKKVIQKYPKNKNSIKKVNNNNLNNV